jgi:transposase InsO family protein
MPRKGRSNEEIVHALGQVEAGEKVTEVCRRAAEYLALRELAAVRVRFGYRRLTVLLKREGWRVNAKRIYRLYGLEGLEVRTEPRKKLASRARVALPRPSRPNERWSMDFVSGLDGRWQRFPIAEAVT